MATLNQTLPTLLDLAKRQDPNGRIAKVVESLTLSTPLLRDMVWKEGNLTTGHLLSTRTALPALTWRKINSGVTASKSQTGQVTETCGMLDGVSKVDVKLAKFSGNPAAFRLSEDLAFMQSYNRELETSYFYASSDTNPEKFHGLSPRLDALSGLTFQNQIIDAGMSPSGADQSSIWIVGWGPNSVYGIYPKGTQQGLEIQDLGQELTSDGAGGEFLAYRTYFSWSCGLAVEDARYLVRICNVDTSSIASTGRLLIDALTKGVEQMQDLESVRPIIYCNRKVRTYLRMQATDSVKNSTLTYDMVGGKAMLHFDGIPIHRSDAILNTEAVVT